MVTHTHPSKQLAAAAICHSHPAGNVAHTHTTGEARYFGVSWRRCPECGGVLVEDSCTHGAPIVGGSSDFMYEAYGDR